jgi:hypothetical protein
MWVVISSLPPIHWKTDVGDLNAPCFLLGRSFDWSMWVVISSLPPIHWKTDVGDLNAPCF